MCPSHASPHTSRTASSAPARPRSLIGPSRAALRGSALSRRWPQPRLAALPQAARRQAQGALGPGYQDPPFRDGSRDEACRPPRRGGRPRSRAADRFRDSCRLLPQDGCPTQRRQRGLRDLRKGPPEGPGSAGDSRTTSRAVRTHRRPASLRSSADCGGSRLTPRDACAAWTGSCTCLNVCRCVVIVTSLLSCPVPYNPVWFPPVHIQYDSMHNAYDKSGGCTKCVFIKVHCIDKRATFRIGQCRVVWTARIRTLHGRSSTRRRTSASSRPSLRARTPRVRPCPPPARRPQNGVRCSA